MSEIAVSSSGRPSMGPVTLPAVACFEFILDESLLEKHLSEPNPGLLILFNSIFTEVIYIYVCKYYFLSLILGSWQ